MSDLTRFPIRELIGELARIADLRRAIPSQVANRSPGGPDHVDADLVAAEQRIIDELRRPGRSLHRPATGGHPGGIKRQNSKVVTIRPTNSVLALAGRVTS